MPFKCNLRGHYTAATKIMTVSWTAGFLPGVVSSSTYVAAVHDVALAPDGGAFVVGEFTVGLYRLKSSLNHSLKPPGCNP